MNYQEYIDSKSIEVKTFGFEAKNLNKVLFPHQKDVVQWALSGGRRAIFCSFGLGKCHGIDTQYCKDGVIYCQEAECQKHNVPTLFDVLEQEKVSS